MLQFYKVYTAGWSLGDVGAVELSCPKIVKPILLDF
jgi:hypothetical protein